MNEAIISQKATNTTKTLEKRKNRGLANASKETRLKVAKRGGQAPHSTRGLQATSDDVRNRISKLGGLARAKQRQRERSNK